MIFKIVFGKEIHLLNSISSYPALISGIKTSFKKLPPSFSISYSDLEGDQISISNQQDFKIFQTTNKTDKPVRITIQETGEEKIVIENLNSEKTGYVEVIEELSFVNQMKESEIRGEESIVSVISQEEVQSMIESEVQKLLPGLTENIIKNVTKAAGSRIEGGGEKKEEKVVHEHVTCDGCGVAPIVGFRYKCLICHNFDFCEDCENKGTHPHAFIKIRKPSQVPKILITSEQDAHEGLEFNGTNFNFKDFKSNPAPLIDLANQFLPGLNLSEQKVKGFLNKMKEGKKECQRGGFNFDKVHSFVNNFFGNPCGGQQKSEEKKEQKVEEKVPEMKKEQQSFDGFATLEERNLVYAEYLADMFDREPFLMLKFIEGNPKLSKCQLAEKWIEENL